MTRPSSARMSKGGRPKSKPVLLTLDRCDSCGRPLPHDEARQDNHMVAAGMACSICDRPLCPTCMVGKVGDEESALIAHYKLDETYATQRAALSILPDDPQLGREIVEQIVEDRVASIMTATSPIVRIETLTKLSRARKSVAPLAYAFDQIVLARLHILRLRGEFKPSMSNMQPTRLTPMYPFVLHNGDAVSSRGTSVAAPPRLPNPPYTMADGANDPLASPATISGPPVFQPGRRQRPVREHKVKLPNGRVATLYTEVTDPGDGITE